MAQPDLIAQKILATDPSEGFGEGTVLPYRKHELDTRGFEAMERAKSRIEMQKEARRRNNEDYYHATIKDLPEHRRELGETFGRMRQDIVSHMVHNNKYEINHASDHALQTKLSNYKQAASDASQLHSDYEKETSKSGGKYTNVPSRNGELLSNLTEKYDKFNAGDHSALGGGLAADPSKHFNSDEYLNDQYKDRKPTEISNDTIKNGALGQEVHGKKVSARFFTKDANGNMVPGVGQEHVDELMKTPTQDPDALQFRHSVYSVVDARLRNKALELKTSDDPRMRGLYGDMGVTEIEKTISSNPQDPHYRDFNKDKLMYDTVKPQIEKYQTGGEDNSIKSGHAYPRPTKDDDDKLQTTTLYDQTRNTTATGKEGEVTATAWHPEEIRLGGKRLDKPIKINATHIYNEATNHSIEKSKTVGENSFSPSRMEKAPYNTKTGKFEAGTKEALAKRKDIGYRWMVAGILNGQNSKEPGKKVMIPYEQVQAEMKLGYGFELPKEKDPFKIKEEDQKQKDIL